jgi:hypothetical protein
MRGEAYEVMLRCGPHDGQTETAHINFGGRLPATVLVSITEPVPVGEILSDGETRVVFAGQAVRAWMHVYAREPGVLDDEGRPVYRWAGEG